MCDSIQSAVIHSSTAGWELAASQDLWATGAAAVPYQPHPLWTATTDAAAHTQYQPELFSFGPEFWAANQRTVNTATRS